jgi:hypothetical protein
MNLHVYNQSDKPGQQPYREVRLDLRMAYIYNRSMGALYSYQMPYTLIGDLFNSIFTIGLFSHKDIGFK